MGLLLVLFVAVPAIELYLLITIGNQIGLFPTLGLIFFTGVVGASLARIQGMEVLRQLQQQTAGGELPTSTLMDGLMILVAGALLITPGVLTDVFGFLCLIPVTRAILKKAMRHAVSRAAKSEKVHFRMDFGAPSAPMAPPDSANMKEVDIEIIEPSDERKLPPPP